MPPSREIHHSEFNEADSSLLGQLNTNPNVVEDIVRSYTKSLDETFFKGLHYSPTKAIKVLHRDAIVTASAGLLEHPVFTAVDEGFSSFGDSKTLADIFEASKQLATSGRLPNAELSVKEKLDLCTMASLIKAHKYLTHRIDPESAKDNLYLNGIAQSINEATSILCLQYIHGFSKKTIQDKFIPKASKFDLEFINESVRRLEQEEKEGCPKEQSIYASLLPAAESGDREGWNSVTTWFAIAKKAGVHLPADIVEALFINSKIKDALNKEWANFYHFQSADPNWDNKIRVPENSIEGTVYHLLERALSFSNEIIGRYYVHDSTPNSLNTEGN